ncbi:MAG: GYF domain-containing protein [Lentisphaeria bacterium]
MNYLMQGGDGQTYGPVAVDTLVQWVKEGRLNAQTKLAPEGTTDWKAAGEYPELASLFAASPAPAPCCCGGHEAGAAPCGPPPVAGEIRIGDCLNRSWALLKADPGLVIGVTVVVMLAQVALGFIPVLGSVAGLLLGGVFTGGLYAFFLKKIRGETASFEDAFAGFKLAFVPLMLTGLVSGVLTMLGLILCIIPGIYVAVCWMFAVPAVMDQKLAFWDGMELSRKTVSPKWFQFFLLMLVSGLVAVAGVLACGVGLVVTIPLSIGMIAYAYEDTFGKKA